MVGTLLLTESVVAYIRTVTLILSLFLAKKKQDQIRHQNNFFDIVASSSIFLIKHFALKQFSEKSPEMPQTCTLKILTLKPLIILLSN